MSHANARTTFHARLLIVERWRAGWPQAHIAAAMGISRRCVGKWIDRFRSQGKAGLRDRSSRPHTTPARTSPAVEQAIIELRRQRRCGPDEIGARLGVPARTVSRVLTRNQIPRPAALDPITGEVIKASKATAIRYERGTPGRAGAHGRQEDRPDPRRRRLAPARRAHRETTRDRHTKLGYDHVHSLVDDHSRLAYSDVLPDEKGPTCAGFRTRAAAYFADHGITRIQKLTTDNAWAYRYSLRQTCTRLGIQQTFITPHCPWQNGKAERYNHTLATEWAYRRPYTSNTERTAALAPRLQHYNTQRRHSALGGRPPISRLSPTS